jgi:hypothetical protein
MSREGFLSKRRSIISRKQLLLPAQKKAAAETKKEQPAESIDTYLHQRPRDDRRSTLPVLVVNSSQDMAKEITMQLTLAMPECSIMYAPTLELAAWILKRRPIQLVVSSPVLPDGSVSRLSPLLSQLEESPDVVVFGNMNLSSAEEFGRSGYEFAAMKPLRSKETDPRQQRIPVVRKKMSSATHTADYNDSTTINALGADIRNDLNNPLQEIVAMVFVAQATQEAAPATQQALAAIDKAANNMAEYVRGLEDRIRDAVAV